MCLSTEVNKLFDARQLSPEAQEDLRKRVVAAVFNGLSRSEAARVFQVSRQSVSAWCQKVKRKGVECLKAQKRGHEGHRLLNKRQEAWVKSRIEDKHPEQLKLPFVLWTREAIQALIQKKYGIFLALRTITDYLKRWGMTPQKPLKIAYQRDPKAVKTWVETTYPEIQARAKAENALIFWGDEMGLRSDHQAGRSFSPKGKTPAIHSTGNRFGCNMISALSNLGQLAFSIFQGSFVVAVFVAFLERLVRFAKGRKVFLIVDGHPVHRAKTAQSWIADHSDQIELFFLPGYSPDLNPDEFLNQDVKATVFSKKRPKTPEDLKALLRAKLHSLQKQPAHIRAYFQARTVRYAAA